MTFCDRTVETDLSSFVSGISPEGVYDSQSAEPGSLRAKILQAIGDVQQGLLERGTEVLYFLLPNYDVPYTGSNLLSNDSSLYNPVSLQTEFEIHSSKVFFELPGLIKRQGRPSEAVSVYLKVCRS